MADTVAEPPRDKRAFSSGFLGMMNAIDPDIDITEAAMPFATRPIAQQMPTAQRLDERLPAAIRAAMRELAG